MLIEWQCSKFPAPFEARVKADSVTPAFRKCGFVVLSLGRRPSARGFEAERQTVARKGPVPEVEPANS